MERLDGEEGMPAETATPPAELAQHVTVVFPPDGDVQISGNATIIQMLAASKLLERAASGMLDQAELSALQTRGKIVPAGPTMLDHLRGRRS